MMRIRVLRDYSGAEGSGPDRDVLAGQEFVVTRARGSELAANGLVEIVEDGEGDTVRESAKADEKPRNKAAPEPKSKAAGKAGDKV